MKKLGDLKIGDKVWVIRFEELHEGYVKEILDGYIFVNGSETDERLGNFPLVNPDDDRVEAHRRSLYLKKSDAKEIFFRKIEEREHELRDQLQKLRLEKLKLINL